jgi:protocatechuate 3,4-dioxygenase beta subunit
LQVEARDTFYGDEYILLAECQKEEKRHMSIENDKDALLTGLSQSGNRPEADCNPFIWDIDSLRAFYLNPQRFIERRTMLTMLGGAGLSALLAACGVGSQSSSSSNIAMLKTDSSSACILTPKLSEGPFYFPVSMVRGNIIENQPGTPLITRFKVVDATTCQPIKGAVVDVWQANATGIYSGYSYAQSIAKITPGPDGPLHQTPTNKYTFLRGLQLTDSQGNAAFQSIYPGWYDHRAVHTHAKIHVGNNVVYTGQLFFPDDVTDKVYKASLYASRGPRTILKNSTDVLYPHGGAQSTFTVQRDGAGGYIASITLGMKTS